MIGDRHKGIGIKRIIRLQWLRKTVNLLLAGLEIDAIRRELNEFLQNEVPTNVITAKGSNETRSFAVGNLMKTWVTPDPVLIPFRNAALDYLLQHPDLDFAIHWGMMCAAYPFWFNTARQTGKLFALQNRITSAQVVNRLKEQYGDRLTIVRNSGYVLSAFREWGALRDSSGKGYYEKVPSKIINDVHLAILLYESALLAMPEAKSPLNQVVHCPSFFPFRLPSMTADFISRNSERMEMMRYGLGEEILRLRE